MRGKGTKLGEGCPKVRLSQDRMPIFSHIRDFYIFQDFYVQDFYVWDCFVREKFGAPK